MFYKGNTDPVIARINTNEQYGLAINTMSDKGGCLKQEPFTSALEDAPRLWNSVYGYGPSLSVVETEPVVS